MTARHFETVTKTFSEMAFFLAQCNVYLLKLCDLSAKGKNKRHESFLQAATDVTMQRGTTHLTYV